MENELHPEIALQEGFSQEKKQFDVHPSLQMELEAQEEQKEEAKPEIEAVTDNQEAIVDKPEIVENPKDRDWRAVRAQAEEAKHIRREKEALERERDFYREQAAQRTQQQPQQDDYRTDTEKQLQHQMEELRQQVLRQEKETSQTKQQLAVAKAEQRLTDDFPDIKSVVSDENVERLKTEYPHLYNAVVSSSDVYTVGSSAYEMIIAKGIYKKQVSPLNQLTQTNIARNQAKPRSTSTIAPHAGESPIKQAASFMGNSISSEEERKALYAEMLHSSRNRV